LQRDRSTTTTILAIPPTTTTTIFHSLPPTIFAPAARPGSTAIAHWLLP